MRRIGIICRTSVAARNPKLSKVEGLSYSPHLKLEHFRTVWHFSFWLRENNKAILIRKSCRKKL